MKKTGKMLITEDGIFHNKKLKKILLEAGYYIPTTQPDI